MGALDSSLVFFLPLGIDFVVILLAARKPELFWLYALLATAGSLAGAAGTFWLGRQVGEHGLSEAGETDPAEPGSRARQSSARAYIVAALALIPPPFPFTAFVLTSGAFAREGLGVLHDARRRRGCSASASKPRSPRTTAAASSAG